VGAFHADPTFKAAGKTHFGRQDSGDVEHSSGNSNGNRARFRIKLEGPSVFLKVRF